MTMMRCQPLPGVSPRCTSANSESMPPSPWLSARMMSTTYLSVMTISRLQKISDSTPMTTSRSIGAPAALIETSIA